MKPLKHTFALILAAVLWTACNTRETTPFDDFAGKEYASYHYALRDTLRKVYATDDEECVMRAVRQMQGLPDSRHDRQWQLEAEFLRLNFYHDYRNGDDDEFVSSLLELKAQALKAGNRVFALRITRRLMDHYGYGNDPVNVIRYACMLEKEQRDITEREFPDVVDNSYRLASLFMKYRKQEKAKPYLEFVLAHDVVPEIEIIFLDAKNDIALMARDTDPERSDSLFLSMISDSTIIEKDLWRGMGLGNYGSNCMARGDYETAELCLQQSFELMRSYKGGDWPFCIGLASELITIYCRTGRMDNAAVWVDIMKEIKSRACAMGADIPVSYYSSISEYESLCLNQAESNVYRDSIVITMNRTFDRWSPAIVADVEKIMLDEDLQEEHEKARAKIAVIVALMFFALTLAAFSVYLLVVIRRKRQLISALSLRNRLWANGGEVAPAQKKHIDIILEYLESSRAYLNHDCSLDSLAKATMLNRSYVSRAINERYRNFNYMLNAFRIREALRIIDRQRDIKVEALREECGFGSTSSFYEAFRTVTGMSLKEYRESIGKS